MNKLTTERRVAVVQALVEGNSIRATCRMTGTAKGTVLRLLAQLGAACSDLHDRLVRNIPAKQLQADEIWSFCHAKARNIPDNRLGERGLGDLWDVGLPGCRYEAGDQLPGGAAGCRGSPRIHA